MEDSGKFDVLVVGAGPVGLVVASELAKTGIPVTIIDKRNKPTWHSKANVLWPRSLELLARLNITDILARQAHQLQMINFHKETQIIASHNFSSLLDSPYPFALTQPQPATEMVLEQNLRQLGITVDRELELVNLQQSEHTVDVVLQRPDKTLENRHFAWVIGADGKNSTVREKSGIYFTNEVVPIMLMHMLMVSQPIKPITILAPRAAWLLLL